MASLVRYGQSGHVWYGHGWVCTGQGRYRYGYVPVHAHVPVPAWCTPVLHPAVALHYELFSTWLAEAVADADHGHARQ